MGKEGTRNGAYPSSRAERGTLSASPGASHRPGPTGKVPRSARDDGYAMFSTMAFPNSLVLSSVAPAISRSKS
jgi:hypothetical protein